MWVINLFAKDMRAIYTIFTLLFLTLFCACETQNLPPITINIKTSSVECACTGGEITISYALDPGKKDRGVTATSNDSWITIINCKGGIVSASIEPNENFESRYGSINLSAPGHKATKIELMQYGTPPQTSKHTLMFYFFGTSLSRYFKTNLEDAAAAIETGILGNNNRVIFFRQESQYSAYIGELYYDINSGKCIEKRIKEITLDSSIIKPEKIGEHIAKMAEIAPAERYGIIFAGHGQGWITREIIQRGADISPSSFSYGYNPWIPASAAEVTRAFGENNVQVNINELAEGIEHSQIELDYILFDACFMSNIETIYELRHVANYIIASPCEIMGKGFPYHHTLPYLFEDNGNSSDYIKAAESYHLFYRDEYTSNYRCGSIAVYDCHEIDALAEITKELAKSARTEYDTASLQTYEGQIPHHFYDFGQWGKVVATDSEVRKQFIEQLNKTVIAKYSLESFYSAYGNYGTYPIALGVYTGVTTSAPSTAYPNGWRETNWYKDVIQLEN